MMHTLIMLTVVAVWLLVDVGGGILLTGGLILLYRKLKRRFARA